MKKQFSISSVAPKFQEDNKMSQNLQLAKILCDQFSADAFYAINIYSNKCHLQGKKNIETRKLVEKLGFNLLPVDKANPNYDVYTNENAEITLT